MRCHPQSLRSLTNGSRNRHGHEETNHDGSQKPFQPDSETSLKTLYVHHGTTEITDQGVAELENLQSLERLAIRQTTVTPAAVEKLRHAVPSLQSIELE